MAFTVTLLNVPILELTVAKVPAAVTFALPSKLATDQVTSPVIDMDLADANFVAVAAFPLMLPPIVDENVLTPAIL